MTNSATDDIDLSSRPQNEDTVCNNTVDDDKFRELTIGYRHCYQGPWGLVEGDWFDMNRPITCYYKQDEKIIILGSTCAQEQDAKEKEEDCWVENKQDDAKLSKRSYCYCCTFSSRSSHHEDEDTPVEPDERSPSMGRHISALRNIPIETRGITLRQLRAIYANVKRRCTPEKWEDYNHNLLTPNQVSLYDVNKYVIREFTKHTKQSFVETLPSTAGSQPPRFFISHWWGEPISNFISCIERLVVDHARNSNAHNDQAGGGMTIDTPVWICAYANNQWELEKSITSNPYETGFTKAIREADFRTVTILDKGAVVFTRIWCILELYLTLIFSKQKHSISSDDADIHTAPCRWSIYTAYKHQYKDTTFGTTEMRDAVGILPGGAPSDLTSTQITDRQSFFPFQRMTQSLQIQVEHAQASVELDRVHILNAIVGNTQTIEELEGEPPETHEEYKKLNKSLKEVFTLPITNQLHQWHSQRRDDDHTQSMFCPPPFP